MQTYAYLCLLGALTAYCFTDTGGKYTARITKTLSLVFVGLFVVTEGFALLV